MRHLLFDTPTYSPWFCHFVTGNIAISCHLYNAQIITSISARLGHFLCFMLCFMLLVMMLGYFTWGLVSTVPLVTNISAGEGISQLQNTVMMVTPAPATWRNVSNITGITRSVTDSTIVKAMSLALFKHEFYLQQQAKMHREVNP